ncbi:hypothetical protein [Herbiconiux solani]|uniref:hypothetical protein n=1 Tax=Herbiconiux solani TaxID=661329 RepID=UPI00082600EB|nr:hypothetical protein [Herbiconiux solani]
MPFRTRTRILRMTAAAAVLAGLGLVLTGCGTQSPRVDTEFERMGEAIGGWPSVESASVNGSYNGLPTSRNLEIEINLEQTDGVDLSEYLNHALENAWKFDVYEPAHVWVDMYDMSVDVAPGYARKAIDLTDAAAPLGFEAEHDGEVSVSADDMAEKYGPWPLKSTE